MANKPYAAMQNLLRDQNAAAQAMKDAALSIKNAADMMSMTMSDNAPTVNGPRGGGGFGDPNGGRPRMRENQSYRPVHTSTSSSHGQGLTGLRSMAAQRLHSTVGRESGSTFEAIHDSEGNHIGYRENHQDGRTTFHDPDSPEAAGRIAAAGVRHARSNLISNFTEGGLAGGARAIPYVGAAIGVAEAGNEIATRVGQEREKNAQYQSIYGGGNFSTGFGNRMQAEGFKLSQRFSGGLTGAQATQAFQGVSNMGFQGQQRSSDLNFISSNYKSMGMDVASSLQLISEAAKTLNTNLTGLKDGLKTVSDQAVMTGQNANQARQAYSQTYGQISATNPGVGAAGLASAVSSMSVGLGRSMQGLDFTSQFTTQGGIAQLAPLAGGLNGQGMSMSQLRGSMSTNPTTALQASDTLMAQITSQFLTTQVKAIIDQEVSKIPGGLATIQSNPDMVASQITPVLEQSGAVNADEVKAAFGRISSLSNITPDQAVTLLIDTYLGLAGNLSKKNSDMLNKKQQDLSKVTTTAGAGGSAGKSNAGNSSLGKNTSYGTSAKGVDPVVDDAKSQLKGKNVIVNTGSGQRVVSIDVAAQSYRDQVAKGTAVVADTGQTVKDTLGGEFEKNYQGTDTSNYNASKGATSKKDGLSSDRGMTVDAYNAMQQKNNTKGSGGTVTISPSKELQQLLNFSTSGNVQVATTGAASGTVPVPGS